MNGSGVSSDPDFTTESGGSAGKAARALRRPLSRGRRIAEHGEGVHDCPVRIRVGLRLRGDETAEHRACVGVAPLRAIQRREADAPFGRPRHFGELQPEFALGVGRRAGAREAVREPGVQVAHDRRRLGGLGLDRLSERGDRLVAASGPLRDDADQVLAHVA